jgi:hypothetical protein
VQQVILMTLEMLFQVQVALVFRCEFNNFNMPDVRDAPMAASGNRYVGRLMADSTYRDPASEGGR